MNAQNQYKIDTNAITKTSELFAQETDLEELIKKLMQIIRSTSEAEKGYLILQQQDIRFLTLEQLSHDYENGLVSIDGTRNKLVIQAECCTSQGCKIFGNVSLENNTNLAVEIVQEVKKTLKPIVLENASTDESFSNIPYIVHNKCRSIFCFPLLQQRKLKGILYLENNSKIGVFTEEKIETLKIIANQMCMSIENVRLYNDMENLVSERTEQLNEFLEELEKSHINLKKAHRQLQETQTQLIHSEKMASLGTMVAGVAHEINNPVNFINIHAKTMKDELLKFRDFLLELLIEEKELSEYTHNQLNNFLEALCDIDEGSKRIKTIVQDLRSFSRLDEAEVKKIKISEGIKSTLRIIKTQYKDIDFVTEFIDDPEIECRPAQLNQVFLNIMNNACYAIKTKQESHKEESSDSILVVKTFTKDDEIGISFTDRGIGMKEETIQKMFDPFFTTKTVGDGTGLGMSVSHSIIERHNGRFEVESKLGEGTKVTVWLKK